MSYSDPTIQRPERGLSALRCDVCHRSHDHAEPHDPSSIEWIRDRREQGLPAPSWTEALEHVTGQMRLEWVAFLWAHGIQVPRHHPTPEAQEAPDA